MKTKFSIATTLFLFLSTPFASVIAQESAEIPEKVPECNLPDADGDKYFASPNFQTETSCDGYIGVKGYEREICDCPEIQEGKYCSTLDKQLTNSDLGIIFDYNKYKHLMKGKDFNPNITDIINDGIDQDCDGFDKKILYSDELDGQDLSDGFGFAITILLFGAISIFLIILGVLLYLLSFKYPRLRRYPGKCISVGMECLLVLIVAIILNRSHYIRVNYLDLIAEYLMLLFAILFLWGCFRYFTSKGDISKMHKAHKMMAIAIVWLIGLNFPIFARFVYENIYY